MSHECSSAISFPLSQSECLVRRVCCRSSITLAVLSRAYPDALACGLVSPKGEVDATPATPRITFDFFTFRFSLTRTPQGGRHVSEFFTKLFSSQDFMPHGDCYLWKPEIVWLHAISDGVIALSYYLIPFVLIYLVRKRKDLPFNAIFVMFGVFIFACGTTHVMEVWTLWHPFYRLSGVIKAFTAVASVGTAVMLVQFVPQALALPSPTQLRTANAQLENEIKERRRVEQPLHHAYDELEVRVQERTADLASANAALRNEIVERQHAQEASETAQSELAHVPGMDGLELQRQLAAASHPIPIIFVTAFGDETAREYALRGGAASFLSKPFSEETLLGAVQSAIEIPS